MGADVSELPPGFVLDPPPQANALPEGFVLDAPASPAAGATGSWSDPADAVSEDGQLLRKAPDGSFKPVPETPTPGAARAATQGAWRSFADTAMLPFDVANIGANVLLSGADKAAGLVGGSVPFRFSLPSDRVASGVADFAKNKLGLDYTQDPQQMSLPERTAYEGSRFAGGAMLGNVFARGLGAGRIAALESSVPAKPRVVDSLLKAYVGDGGANLAGDALAGLGAGMAYAGTQSIPDSVRDSGWGAVGPIADLAAMLLGGMAGGGTATIARNGVQGTIDDLKFRLGRAALPYDPQTGEAVLPRDVNDAARFMQEQARQGVPAGPGQAEAPRAAAGAIRRNVAERQAEGIPVPTTGLIAENPGLAGVDKGTRIASDNRAQFVARDNAVRDYAVNQVAGLAPPGANAEVPIETVTQQAQLREAQALRAAEEARAAQEAHAAQQAAAAQEAAYSSTLQDRAAQRIDRTVVDETLRPMNERRRELYASIDPEGTATIDPAGLAGVAREIRAQMNEVMPGLGHRQVSPEFDAVLQGMIEAADKGQRIPFNQIEQSRPALSQMAAQAREAKQFALAENIDRFRAALGQQITQLVDQGGFTGHNAAIANAYFGQEYAPVWARGPGDEAQKFRRDYNRDPTERTTTPPSQTAGRFLDPAKPEAAEALRRIFGASERPRVAAQAARDYLVRTMQGRGVVVDSNGRPAINLAALRAWRNEWDPVLAQFPRARTLADEFIQQVQQSTDQGAQLAQRVRDADTQITEARGAFREGANRFLYDKSPDRAVAAVMASDNPARDMRAVVARLGGKGADTPEMNGWKKAVADHLYEKTVNINPGAVSEGTDTVSFDKLVRSFKQNEKVLAEVFSPTEMNALRRVQKALEPLQNLRAQATVGSPTAENSQFGMRALELLLRARYGALKGGGIMRNVKIGWSMRGNDNPNYGARRLVERAMLDPDIAVFLLETPVREVGRPAWNNRLQAKMRDVMLGREVWGGEREDDRNGR